MTNILIPKETRAGELRVAMIPHDVEALISKGHKIYIEHNAGHGAGFADQDYQNIGAKILSLDNPHSVSGFKKFFDDINMIVRVKRPDRNREILENKALSPGMIMVGALDPLEKHSSHIDEYHDAGVIAYSIDQQNFTLDDPMNILAAMSKMAGKLALLDAISQCHVPIKKVIIIGFGVVGQAAFDEALSKLLPTTVILNNQHKTNEILKQGGDVLLLDGSADLKQQQAIVKNALLDADIVIASARRANQPAPLLIPLDTLQHMHAGSVIVDMALSEGGNVEGSAHDATLILGNDIIVTNTSGYPKAMPHDASKCWSAASALFVAKLIEGDHRFAAILK